MPALRPRRLVLAAVALLVATAACGGAESTNDDEQATTATTVATPPTSAPATTPITSVPLGDGRTTTAAKAGYVLACNTRGGGGGGGGAMRAGPWIDEGAATWTPSEKIAVAGSVDWESTFDLAITDATTRLTGNGLPSTPTGVFPVAANDPAYAYDRNPNSIRPYELDVQLPSEPRLAATPTCVGGTIGVSVLGAAIYSAFDALGRDAVAHEVQDACDGHPQRTGQYHFHSLSDCLDDAGAAVSGADPGLFGYALDGFGIYVERGADGELLTTADLDECHGRTSEITWHGEKVTMYHYVATDDFPYLVGCYRGTPIPSATGLSIGRPAPGA